MLWALARTKTQTAKNPHWQKTVNFPNPESQIVLESSVVYAWLHRIFFQKTCLLLCIEPWHKNSLISSHLSHYTASQTTLLSLLTSCEQPVMDYCMSIGIYVIICPFFAGWREKRWTRYWYAWAVRDPQTSVAAGNSKMKPQGEGGTRCSEWQQDQLVNTHLHFNLPLEWHTHWQPSWCIEI